MLFAWANAKLRHAEAGQIEDVGAGFDNGIMLANLIKAVTGETVTKIAQNPRVLAMKLDNLKKCLERLDDLGVDVRDISPTSELLSSYLFENRLTDHHLIMHTLGRHKSR